MTDLKLKTGNTSAKGGESYTLLKRHKQGSAQLEKGDKIKISTAKVQWFRDNGIIA